MIVLIVNKKPGLAGWGLPFLLIKPQLMILLIPALLWKGGRRFILTSTLSLLGVVAISCY